MRYIILILVLVLVFLVFFYSSKVRFLFKKDHLINDTDNYLQKLSTYDLQARKVKSISEYISLIEVEPFSSFEKIRLIYLCNIVDWCLYFSSNTTNHFDTEKASKIKWNLIKVTPTYENGYPHTRNDNDMIFIVLSTNTLKHNNDNLLRILLHEKVHVYQKLYPQDTQLYISNAGFTKTNLRKYYDKIRSNPDLDDYVYSKDNQLYLTTYKNIPPKSISDTITLPINNTSYEHPLEMMAYELENLIENN